MTSLIEHSIDPKRLGRIDREGRTHFDNLESAMRFYGVPIGAQRIVRETLGVMAYDDLWVPRSRCYIAVRGKGAALAWVHKTKIGIPGRSRVELPGYAARSRIAGSARVVRDGETCPKCFLAMPMAGGCQNCD